jgi:hypothetical protein
MAVHSSKLVPRIPWPLSGAAILRTACRETPLSLSPSVYCEKLTGAELSEKGSAPFVSDNRGSTVMSLWIKLGVAISLRFY